MLARRPLLALACFVALPACRTWRPAGAAGAGDPGPAGVAQAVAAASGPGARPVRVTTRGGELVVLLAPRAGGDSVVGTDARARTRRAVARADVARVEAWRVGAGTTLAGVAAGALAAAAVLYGLVSVAVLRGT